jgi:hypothetical protein
MATPRRPGWRPWGFWRFDVGLEPALGRRFVWLDGTVSQQHMVYQHHADAAERAQIEAEWRKAVRVAVSQRARDHVACLVTLWHVPRDFAEQHLPAPIAALEAERRA